MEIIYTKKISSKGMEIISIKKISIVDSRYKSLQSPCRPCSI